MIDKIVECIEKAISGESFVDTSIAEIKKIKEKDGTNRYSCCIRLLYAFRDKKLIDFCSHLRQSILVLGRSLRIKSREFFKAAEENRKHFGFEFEGANDNIKVLADRRIVPNEYKISSAYEYKERKIAAKSVGDGRLFRFTKYPTYMTFSQKVLLKHIAKMQDGDTLMASLSTGGGKSMAWQLPAIPNDKGLIVVVVPTVALAIDHTKSSKALWAKNNLTENLPAAYYSDVGYKEKQDIKDRIMSGSLPILYISPEALLQKEFQDMVLAAAAEDKISMLVVDEAHLVVGWAGFRPEFQLIASLRNNINAKCAKIKTILLSATLNENDSKVLKRMFTGDGNWIEVRADALRPEIEYRMRVCENDKHRKELTLALINQAPKPMIIYVMHKNVAVGYLKQLQEFGYKNVRMFTGDTGGNDRRRIIAEWDSDEVDIIVATSAFGMGVDKSDVRTIIHTFVPENVNRFFQETGRAGRDGYAALSYWLVFARDDKENARSMTSSEVATSATIASRWKAMSEKAKIIDSDCTWLSISVPPEHLRLQYVGNQNAGWNQSILLFLYRHGFIDILDVVAVPNKDDYKIKIRLLKIKELENINKLESVIEPYREQERQYINNQQNLVERMIKDEGCFSKFFASEYPYAAEICSGCQHCFTHGNSEFYNEGQIRILSDKPLCAEPSKNRSQLGISLQLDNEVLVLWKDNYDIIKTVIQLAESGVANIVLPECTPAVEERIVKSDDMKFFDVMLVSAREFMHYNTDNLLLGTTALIIGSGADTKEYFEFAERYLKKKGNKVVFVTEASTEDRRKRKPLTETMNACLKIEDI